MQFFVLFKYKISALVLKWSSTWIQRESNWNVSFFKYSDKAYFMLSLDILTSVDAIRVNLFNIILIATQNTFWVFDCHTAITEGSFSECNLRDLNQ